MSQLATLPTFVGVVKGCDVGIVRGSPDDEDVATAWLISLWIDPAHRGHGLGQALVGQVVSWATDAGYRSLCLGVSDRNASAIALYDRLGFQRTGEVETLPAPRQHITEFVMERSLI